MEMASTIRVAEDIFRFQCNFGNSMIPQKSVNAMARCARGDPPFGGVQIDLA